MNTIYKESSIPLHWNITEPSMGSKASRVWHETTSHTRAMSQVGAQTFTQTSCIQKTGRWTLPQWPKKTVSKVSGQTFIQTRNERGKKMWMLPERRRKHWIKSLNARPRNHRLPQEPPTDGEKSLHPPKTSRINVSTPGAAKRGKRNPPTQIT